ncbi:MAG TPA: hypothetical protein DDY52_01500 [Candidatus Moranbacteria bacterium]|nr:MAG: hypothetical protein UR51_C0010G0028 [Candidatus Moranbacteria bacterium GW2011_GWF1_34_10]HBI16818.1 hypothetical protein [Candidatus Moranbacteria bacterium]
MEIETGASKFRRLHEKFPNRRKHDLFIFFEGDIAIIKSYLGDWVLVCKIFAQNMEAAIRTVAHDWKDGFKRKYYTCNRVKGTSRCMNKISNGNCPKRKGIPCRCRNFSSLTCD